MVRQNLVIALNANAIDVFALGDLPHRSDPEELPPSGDTTRWVINLTSAASIHAEPPAFSIPIAVPSSLSTYRGHHLEPSLPKFPSEWYLGHLDSTAPVVFEMGFHYIPERETHTRLCRFELDFTTGSAMARFTVSIVSAFLVPKAQTARRIHHYGVAEVSFEDREGEVLMPYLYDPDPNVREGLDQSGDHGVRADAEPNVSVWRRERVSRLHHSSHMFLTGCPTGRYVWRVPGLSADEERDRPGHIYFADYHVA